METELSKMLKLVVDMLIAAQDTEYNSLHYTTCFPDNFQEVIDEAKRLLEREVSDVSI